MSSSVALVPSRSAGSGDLDALLVAVADGIDAVVACNFAAFQSAVERQRILCERLADDPEWRLLPGAAVTARKVQELNRVYERLLRHSVQWTRTLQSIFEAGGVPALPCTSVHFKG